MKRNRNIILLLLLACAQMIMAQHVLTGTVMDKVFNEPWWEPTYMLQMHLIVL